MTFASTGQTASKSETLVDGSLLTKAEINRYIKKIKMQQEIIPILKDMQLSNSKERVTLFGNVKQRCCKISWFFLDHLKYCSFLDIAESVILSGNVDLAIGIILNFQLPSFNIVNNAMTTLIKTGELKQGKQLIERAKVLKFAVICF